jgi:hypothetical protein
VAIEIQKARLERERAFFVCADRNFNAIQKFLPQCCNGQGPGERNGEKMAYLSLADIVTNDWGHIKLRLQKFVKKIRNDSKCL